MILASILLEIERAFDFPFFRSDTRRRFASVGAPVLAVTAIPRSTSSSCRRRVAVSMILPTLARNPLMGYSAIIVALIANGPSCPSASGSTYMFTEGIPHLALAFFSAASALVAIPTGPSRYSRGSRTARAGLMGRRPLRGCRCSTSSAPRHLRRRWADGRHAGHGALSTGRLTTPISWSHTCTMCWWAASLPRCWRHTHYWLPGTSPGGMPVIQALHSGFLADLRRLQHDVLA